MIHELSTRVLVRINCHGTSTERDLKRLHQTATLQLQMTHLARVFLPRFCTQFVLFIFLHEIDAMLSCCNTSQYEVCHLSFQ